MTRRAFVWVSENCRSGQENHKKTKNTKEKKMGITRPSPDGGVKRVANLWEDRKVRESGVPTVSR